MASRSAWMSLRAVAVLERWMRRPLRAARDPDMKILFCCMGNICRSPTAEGVVRMMAELAGYPRKKRSFLGRLAGFMFKRRFSYLNPDQYNGASLLGLRGIVVKSHGGADAVASLACCQAQQ